MAGISCGALTACHNSSRSPGAQPSLFVGWFWFLGTLVPMIGLVQVGTQAMADRYAYLSFIGLYLMLCWGVADPAQQWHLPAAVLPAASIAVLFVLMVVTYRQIGYWKDDVTLWSHTVKVTNSNWVAEDNLGQALVAQGRMEEAMPHFFTAAAIFPPDPTSKLEYRCLRAGTPGVFIEPLRNIRRCYAIPTTRCCAGL